jgi:ATP-binding cassette subfamily B (MDR/TAP) protein 1
MGSTSLGMVAPAIPDFIKAAAAAKSVFDTLDEIKSEHIPSEKRQITDLNGHIRFENVSFCYPSRPNVSVLSNATMSFAPNQITALVGPSGSGKSTIVALLERWYEVQDGSISIDESFNIKELDLDWWRSQVSLVQQVRENYS